MWIIELQKDEDEKEAACTLDTSIQESLTAATIATNFRLNFTKYETKID